MGGLTVEKQRLPPRQQAVRLYYGEPSGSALDQGGFVADYGTLPKILSHALSMQPLCHVSPAYICF